MLADEALTGAVGLADVELFGVRKRFGGQSRGALDLPRLSLPAGQLTSVLGPSGCGKTTLLRILAGLDSVDEGRLTIGGADIAHLPPSERDVGLVAQGYALFPHMCVLANVAFGLQARNVAREAALARAREALATLQLAELEQRLPAELSGGQQQRVAIARAVVIQPRVLLLDEPLSNLDARLRRHVREDIRELQRRTGLTVVYVTHDASEALAVSDRIVVMNHGRVVQEGAPRDIYERPTQPFVADFFDDTTLFDVELDNAGRARLGPLTLPRAPDASCGRACAAIRPEAWVALAPSYPGLPATVLNSAYLGATQEVWVQTDIGTFIIRCPSAKHLYQPGAPISLRLHERGGIALLPRP